MSNKIVIATVLIGVALAALPVSIKINKTDALPTDGRTVIFRDEFTNTGNTVDPNKWSTCYWYGCTNASNKELQWYRPNHAWVSNGTLKLIAKNYGYDAEDGKHYDYTSGMITSDGKFSFQYGYVEARAKTPAGKGFWPTIWLMPTDHSWPPEIDFLEQVGHISDTNFMGYHYINDAKQNAYVQQTKTHPTLNTEFHVYGVDWQPHRIDYYFDGRRVASYINKYNVTDKPMYLLANLAVGRQGVDVPDSSTPFPSNMEIDYIRVFK